MKRKISVAALLAILLVCINIFPGMATLTEKRYGGSSGKQARIASPAEAASPSDAEEPEEENTKDEILDSNDQDPFRDMTNSDFEIKDGVLIRYNGTSKDVMIPDEVKSFENPFYGKEELIETIKLPDGFETVKETGQKFYKLPNLKSIEVSKNSSHFFTMDGALYEWRDEGAVLVSCPSARKGTELDIPTNVTGIEDWGIYQVKELTSIVFNDDAPQNIDYTFFRPYPLDKATYQKVTFHYYSDTDLAGWKHMQETYGTEHIKWKMDKKGAAKFPTIVSRQGSVKDFNNIEELPEGKKWIWETFDEKIVNISKEGMAEGKAEGITVVTGQAEDKSYTLQFEYICVPDINKISNQYEREVAKLTNKERMAQGKPPLSFNTSLQKATDIRKAELQKLYSHDRPNGSDCFTVLDELEIDYWGGGENIADGYSGPKSVVKAWMTSTGHRENILADFKHLGVGYASSNKWVQMFIEDNEIPENMILDHTEKVLNYKSGTSISEMDINVAYYCPSHGFNLIPVIDDMCSGYNASTTGALQTVTVCYGNWSQTFDIMLSKGSSGSSSSGGGGGSSGGSDGFDGSISTGASGPGGGAGNMGVPAGSITGLWKQLTEDIWTFTSSAGTEIKNSWAYLYNPYAVAGQEAADWFYFDIYGIMQTGWFTDTDGYVYYLNTNSDGTRGKMCLGWKLIDGRWYYFSGVSDGHRGHMLQNTYTPDGFYVGESGERLY